MVRVSWDFVGMESKVMSAINMLRENGIPKRKIGVFILIGFEDTPDDALYRLNTIRNMGFYPFPMRYQRLDAVKRNDFVGKRWTNRELIRFSRYWANLRLVGKIPFEEFRY